MIVIRLQRGGRVHKPVFSIVAADKRNARDGKYTARLGQYDPALESPFKDVKVAEIKGWLAKGAQISDALKPLFRKHNVLGQ